MSAPVHQSAATAAGYGSGTAAAAAVSPEEFVDFVNKKCKPPKPPKARAPLKPLPALTLPGGGNFQSRTPHEVENVLKTRREYLADGDARLATMAEELYVQHKLDDHFITQQLQLQQQQHDHQPHQQPGSVAAEIAALRAAVENVASKQDIMIMYRMYSKLIQSQAQMLLDMAKRSFLAFSPDEAERDLLMLPKLPTHQLCQDPEDLLGDCAAPEIGDTVEVYLKRCEEDSLAALPSLIWPSCLGGIKVLTSDQLHALGVFFDYGWLRNGAGSVEARREQLMNMFLPFPPRKV